MNSYERNNSNDELLDNIRVFVRIRPMDDSDREVGIETCVKVGSTKSSISVFKSNSPKSQYLEKHPKMYYFDKIFEMDTSQMNIYSEMAQPIVNKVLQGYNGTILAYGPTGTGKTYTMTGFGDSVKYRGIIQNTFCHIFSHIANAKKNIKYCVKVSYLEIYKEEIRDLLSSESRKNLEVKEILDDYGKQVYVDNLSRYIVDNEEDILRIMKIGHKKRSIGSTNKNLQSSRSHSIFSIMIESKGIDEHNKEIHRNGKLQLVDLAGSERQCKTRMDGTRLREATKNNTSLLVLGNVISSLVDGKSTHIPYRNSLLTRLLQDSLGGNSKTVMCATISPSETHYDETLLTLRYANRAKNIQNNTHINEQYNNDPYEYYKCEIISLRQQLTELEELDYSDYSINSSTDSLHSELHTSSVSYPNKESLDLFNEDTSSEHQLHPLEMCQTETQINDANEIPTDKFDDIDRLIREANKEIDLLSNNEQKMKERLENLQVEQQKMKSQCSSLEGIVVDKSKKLHRIREMLIDVRSQIDLTKSEHGKYMTNIKRKITKTTQETSHWADNVNKKLSKMYLAHIESYLSWDEDIEDWKFKDSRTL